MREHDIGAGGDAEAAELAFIRLVEPLAVRAAALLFRKDVRLLARAPALLLVLVVYPLLVALLVALALQSDDRKPDVALVVQDASGRSVEVGERRLSIDDYVDRLSEDVNVRELDAADAQAALDDGRVAAVLTVPDRFIADLQSGVRPPTLRAHHQPPLADRVRRDRAPARGRRLPPEPAPRHGLRRARCCSWSTSSSRAARSASSAAPATRSACGAAASWCSTSSASCARPASSMPRRGWRRC